VTEENNFTAETGAVLYDALPTTVRNWQFDSLCLRRVSIFFYHPIMRGTKLNSVALVRAFRTHTFIKER